MKKRTYIILGIIAIVVIAVIIYYSGSKESPDQVVKAQKGVFEIIVTTTGELQASSSVKIEGPDEMRGRNVRINDLKILDLIPEGTVVDSGDYVGALDPSSLDNTKKNTETELEQIKAQYENALVDTSLNLKSIRDNIHNLLFSLEETKIVVEQSIYEPPATQRKAQNDYDRALRNYEQELKKYDLRQEQEIGKIKDIQIRLSRKQDEYNDLMELLSKFKIYAPAPGMLIYYKDWSGDKRKIGSTINPWDKIIATLPDLSIMVSKTYVNEVDISKVKAGQKVKVGVDAFPDKKYTGVIISVANTGEQLRNSDAKVFEVLVRLNESDQILRPSMTTSNEIVISTFNDVIFVPLEAIYADTIPFVYRTNGAKQVVVTGEMNDNFRVIEQGLSEGDEVYLSIPAKPETFKLVGEDLIKVIREREAEKKKEEELRKQKDKEREQEMEQFRRRRGNGQMPGGFFPGGQQGGAPQGGGMIRQRRGN